MDYRNLLKKYMDLIGQCEGVYFLKDIKENPSFEKEEVDELIVIAVELRSDS